MQSRSREEPMMRTAPQTTCVSARPTRSVGYGTGFRQVKLQSRLMTFRACRVRPPTHPRPAHSTRLITRRVASTITFHSEPALSANTCRSGSPRWLVLVAPVKHSGPVNLCNSFVPEWGRRPPCPRQVVPSPFACLIGCLAKHAHWRLAEIGKSVERCFVV